MKKTWMGALVVVSFVATQAWSEEPAATAATKVPPAKAATSLQPSQKAVVPLETLTLTGKLVKEEVDRKAKNGTESKVTIYRLKMEDGTTVELPPSRPAKGQVAVNAAINYDNYVDKQVQVVGPGRKIIYLQSVVSMAEATAVPTTDAAAVVPAVPAATPAVAPTEEKK